jgi:hypothetical protein
MVLFIILPLDKLRCVWGGVCKDVFLRLNMFLCWWRPPEGAPVTAESHLNWLEIFLLILTNL